MTRQAESVGSPEVPSLLLRTPTDLVEAIPYLLGFRPAQSLVVVVLHAEPSSVAIALRVDLPPDDAADAAGCELAAHASMHAADRVVLVVFATERPVADGLPHRLVVSRVSATLQSASVAVVDALCVAGERCWSYLCADPQCCPAEGWPLPGPDGDRSEVAAAAARAGLAALPSRSALVDDLEPAAGPARDAMEHALGAAEARFIEAAAAHGIPAWRTAATSLMLRAIDAAGQRSSDATAASALGDEQVAEMLVALSDTAVRDDCWLAVETALPGGGMALWRELARRAVPPYDVAPLFLHAWVGWRRGDGVLARLAAERAVTSDAGYGAARLLLDAIEAGLDPRSLPGLAPGHGSRRTHAGGPR